MPDRDLADRDVVCLRSGEVLQGGPPRLRPDHAQVGLKFRGGPDRGLGRAGDDHLAVRRGGEIFERVHDPAGLRLVAGGREDVDIADRLPHPAQRPGIGHLAGVRLQRRDDLCRGVHRDGQQHPVGGHHRKAPEDALLASRAEPGEVTQPARLDRFPEVLDAGDAEFGVEHEGALGPEAGHPGKVADARRDLASQGLDCRDGAGSPVLGDLGRDRLADAGNGGERGVVHRGYVGRVARDGLGGLLIVPRPERVPAGYGQQFRVLPQQRGHVVVGACHAPIVPRGRTWSMAHRSTKSEVNGLSTTLRRPAGCPGKRARRPRTSGPLCGA